MGLVATYIGVQDGYRDFGKDRLHVFDIWKHVDSNDETDQMVQWCIDGFGQPGQRWQTSAGFIYFSCPDDAFAFRMRWC
ncbi:MAG: hypothetical protein EOO77_37635 [Oxalobacteraceae bacterium]|nr:MAG: hypothetical protein EOO77_37635 [Oxalobacteraceae bacterium]